MRKNYPYATDEKTFGDNLVNGNKYGPGGNGPWPMRSIGAINAWHTRREKYGPSGLKKGAKQRRKEIRQRQKDIQEGRIAIPIPTSHPPKDMLNATQHIQGWCCLGLLTAPIWGPALFLIIDLLG